MASAQGQVPSERDLYDVLHGEVLRRQRERLGLSRTDLADRLRETRSADYVSKVERGDRPADRVRDEMAERLGFDPIALARLVHAVVDEIHVRPGDPAKVWMRAARRLAPMVESRLEVGAAVTGAPPVADWVSPLFAPDADVTRYELRSDVAGATPAGPAASAASPAASMPAPSSAAPSMPAPPPAAMAGPAGGVSSSGGIDPQVAPKVVRRRDHARPIAALPDSIQPLHAIRAWEPRHLPASRLCRDLKGFVWVHRDAPTLDRGSTTEDAVVLRRRDGTYVVDVGRLPPGRVPAGKPTDAHFRTVQRRLPLTLPVEAFRSATVVVDLPDGESVELVPGTTVPTPAELGLGGGIQVAAGGGVAIVTAHNPDAREVPDDENDRRHGDLLRRVERVGWPWLPAVGRGDVEPDGSQWSERSLALVGVDRDRAIALADDFHQSGIFWWSDAGLELVLMCDPESPDLLAPAG